MIEDLWILNHYPFTDKTEFTYWLCGTVDLREIIQYDIGRKRKWSPEKYVHCILTEVGRAMNYVKRWDDEDSSHGFKHQGEIAHKMWELFSCGNVGWDPDLAKNKSEEEIERLIRHHHNRISIVRGESDDAPQLWDITRKRNQVEDYGIYAVHHFPLTQEKSSSNDIKVLYNVQELAAIYLMVTCEFENMC